MGNFTTRYLKLETRDVSCSDVAQSLSGLRSLQEKIKRSNYLAKFVKLSHHVLERSSYVLDVVGGVVDEDAIDFVVAKL